MPHRIRHYSLLKSIIRQYHMLLGISWWITIFIILNPKTVVLTYTKSHTIFDLIIDNHNPFKARVPPTLLLVWTSMTILTFPTMEHPGRWLGRIQCIICWSIKQYSPKSLTIIDSLPFRINISSYWHLAWSIWLLWCHVIVNNIVCLGASSCLGENRQHWRKYKFLHDFYINFMVI